MPRVGFEPTISAGERPKTYALRSTHIVWNFYAVRLVFPRNRYGMETKTNTKGGSRKILVPGGISG